VWDCWTDSADGKKGGRARIETGRLDVVATGATAVSLWSGRVDNATVLDFCFLGRKDVRSVLLVKFGTDGNGIFDGVNLQRAAARARLGEGL